ncbi:CHC2 zinc finger domain-containing protein [Janthinobacterium sp.]|uniref:CHC2 zinc finger domain-containing protein n=1 Tax=Janthinobacterium sp. TaxID=1871054 RepID=UPI002582A5CB|nr:CHC2 zinc finger domain-containing protein [Janthinobacterium sp.]MCX7289596.1 CHC2 zinc finger domain-containing protein [Janthinobacterium sp.]
MARIAEAEIERLKTEVALVRLMEAAGIELRKQGKNYACRCPFHDEATASLIVTPSKNLFHCFGCGAAGGPVDWLMKFDKLSFRAAVERLRSELGLGTTPAPSAPLATGKFKAAPLPLAADADGQAAMRQVLDYYHATLKQSPEALDYLQARGLNHPELIERFKLGYANRTLGYRLPNKAWKEGQEVRGRLQAVGLLRESGHEHFNGSLVVPVIDTNGVIHEVYGRKVLNNLRAGTAYHLYLPGPHAGVWNEEGVIASGGEVILCEALIDAMTFWVHGLRNVTASYGAGGFTDDHLATFQRHGVKRVLIAYDRDDAGNQAAAALAEKLAAQGIGCYRILFPKGMDANEYALKMAPPDKALALLIRKAEWMDEGRGPAPTSAPLDAVADVSALAADMPLDPPAPVIPEPTLASPQPSVPQVDTPIEQSDAELVLTYGDRRYRVRGWKKPLNPEALKVNLLVSRDERFHVDTFDLYQAKARVAFIKQASIELGEAEDVLKHDLGRVLLKLEELQTANLQAALKKEDEGPKLSDAEQAAALELLKSPELLARILADFDACGVVGEETNKLVGYLAAVSRQLDKPLAVLIQSSSAAGKSSLMDAVLALMPEESQVRYSAMTGQSLFYMGETSLKHKILAIAEEEGAAQASYALKLLQSDGQVSMASTGKDATTGLLTTHEYKVEGPVMLFLTTTAIDIDEELLNRCVVLTVNESREQTRAIHALQRKRQTLEGLLADEGRDAILTLHRNAQRLLQPVKVVNPFADRLTFLDDKTRTRRDHMKYLSLIRAITFLHQYQRTIHTVQHRGKAVRYIEVTADDISTANRLAHDVLGRTLDELPPQTRKLLTTLHGWVKVEAGRLAMKLADLRFSRRQVRELTGWGDTQLKIHLARLAELEYILAHRVARGQGLEYELVYDGEGDAGGRFLMGLADMAQLDGKTTLPYDAQRSGVNSEWSAPGRGVVGVQSATGRSDEITLPANAGGACDESGNTEVQKPRQAITARKSSYRSSNAMLATSAAGEA